MKQNNTTKQYTEYGTPVLLIVWSKTIQRNSTLSTVHQCCWLYEAKQYDETVHWVRYTIIADPDPDKMDQDPNPIL